MRWAVVFAGAILISSVASSQDRFVGAEGCKLCHRGVYASWRRTPHATTGTGALGAGCKRCHSTGPRGDLAGVQCEACHGAGANYWLPEVMIDPEKAAMAGLVKPAESVCRACHGSDEPGHRADFEMPEADEWTVATHAPSRP